MKQHHAVMLGLTISPERRPSKRQIAKDYHRAIRAIDAPDERRKVAQCPKCCAWFASVDDRNAHRALARSLPGGCEEAENPVEQAIEAEIA